MHIEAGAIAHASREKIIQARTKIRAKIGRPERDSVEAPAGEPLKRSPKFAGGREFQLEQIQYWQDVEDTKRAQQDRAKAREHKKYAFKYSLRSADLEREVAAEVQWINASVMRVSEILDNLQEQPVEHTDTTTGSTEDGTFN